MWRVQYWGPTSESWIRDSDHTTLEEAQIALVKTVFEDPSWNYRIREIKENTNDQPG